MSTPRVFRLAGVNKNGCIPKNCFFFIGMCILSNYKANTFYIHLLSVHI